MEYRIAKYSDYEMLKEWWRFWRFPIPPIVTLPQEDDENFSGVIACENNKNIACGFLYKTNSALCWLEYIVTNPNTSSEERNLGIKTVIEQLSIKAKELGYEAIFSSIKNENLINKYKELGFIEGSKGTTEMIKILY